MITNKTSYDLNLHTFEGEISKIIKVEDNEGIGFKILPLTWDFQSMFPMISTQKKKLWIRSSDSITTSQFHGKIDTQFGPQCIEMMDYGKYKNSLEPNVRIKSIIVANHKECLVLIQKKEVSTKHRSKNKWKASKRNLR